MSIDTQAFVASSTAKLADVNYGKMQEIARAIHGDSTLLAAFERAPEETAFSINGFVLPEGFHLHLADADNKLYPAEEQGVFGSETVDDWSRLEVRAGYKTISVVACASPV